MGRRWFLVFFIATSSIVSAEPVIYVLKGRPVIVETPVTDPPDEILWKHNGNKVVEYDGKQQYVYGSYKERVVLDWSSAQLEIQDLTYEDSGEYVLEVFKSTNLRQIIYKVEVIDNVAKPTISCQMNESSSSNTHGNEATLNCFVESRQPLSLLKFEWIIDGNIQPGPKLAITLGGAHDNEEYKCRVSNPLSSEMATFTTKDCYADKPNVAVILIALLIVLAGICVLALVLGVVLWKLRKHKGSNKDTTQNKDCDPLLSPGLNKNTDKTVCPPPCLVGKPSLSQPLNNDEIHADAEKPREPGPSNSEETTEPDPAGNNDSENPTTTDGSKKTTIQNDENIPLKPPVNVKNLIDAFEPKSREPGPSNSEETTEPDPAGSNKDTTQNKDCDPLLSPGLNKNTDKTVCPPPCLVGKPSLSQPLNNDEIHADAEKPREPGPSNSEETTEPDPAGNNDSENPTTTDGSKKTTIQNDENIPLKPPGSNKDTTQNKDCDPLLSPGLNKNTDKTVCPPPCLVGKPSLSQPLNNDEIHADAEKPREPGPSNSEETTEPDPAGNNDSENPTTTDGSKKTTIQNDENIPLKPPVNVKNLIDAFEPKSQEPGPSNSEETTEPDPAGSNKDTTQNKDCDPLLSPDPEKMSDEESCLDSSQKNGNMEILKNSDELKTGAYSDQVTGETLENVGVCNSLGFRKINDPDDNAASQNDPETTAYVQDSVLSQKESSTTVNDHKERDKSPSEDVNESAHYQEQIEAGKNFPLNTPQKLLIPPKPPRHISALPITNASHADPEKGGKTRHDSQKEQSDSSTTQVEKCDCEGEAVDDEGQGSPTEEQLHRQQE
ncbi:uncharacterized protein [Channa argus]|uniref:uncharacterized protein isoform X3 n=1 Tax=Channa argus TaxID=215402 RepID=UPI003522ADE8